MKKYKWSIIAIAMSAAAFVSSARAQVNIIAIYGSGNPDNGWSISTHANLQLGLRAKNRDTGAVPWSPTNQYSFPTGTSTSNPTRALWNWDFSIAANHGNPDSTSAPNLSDYSFLLWVDTDPSAAHIWAPINPVLAFGDNSYGFNSTANGAGMEALFSSVTDRTVAQNSENIIFWGGDPNSDGIYSYKLAAYDLADPGHLNPLASVGIEVLVGGGAVPEPSTYGLIGAAGLVGLIALRRVRSKGGK